MRRSIIASTGFFLSFTISGIPPADAQTTPGQDLQVSASVSNTCAINSVGQLDFGEVAPGQGWPAQTAFALSCTLAGSAPVTIFIDDGDNLSASNVRQMIGQNTGNTIRYQVCTDPSCGTLWPTGGVGTTISGSTSLNVYGLINSTYAADADVEDIYSDTLTVTMSY